MSKNDPTVPVNQQRAVHAALHDLGFRNALKAGDRQQISDALDRLKINFADEKTKQEALDQFLAVDWTHLQTLEALMGRADGHLDPLMG